MIGLAVLGVGASLGCQKDEQMLMDSEGRHFSMRCGANQQDCSLRQTSGAPSKLGAPRLRSTGRLVGVCDGDGPEALGTCRPLICEEDVQCPAGSGLQGSCVGSLCVEPSHPLGSEDAVMLCLSGTGLGQESPEQVARFALAVNCGDPCRIPAPCRKP